MNDLLGKDKIMENNNEPKSAIRIILGFFDYYENKRFHVKDYSEKIDVSDDTIRNWMKNKCIRTDSIQKIQLSISNISQNKQHIMQIFTKYILDNHNNYLSDTNKQFLENASSIGEIIEYFLDGSYYNDFKNETEFKLDEYLVPQCYKSLQKKITHDIHKNTFYEIKKPKSNKSNDHILLCFSFPKEIYKVMIYLTDKNLSLRNKIMDKKGNKDTIKTLANQFDSSFDETDRANAYVIFTDNYYPQKTCQTLMTSDPPIYIKKISNRKLEKQSVTINYRSNSLSLNEMVLVNKITDYMLYLLQCDFDLFLKNAIASKCTSYRDIKKDIYNEGIGAYQQELEFEAFLLKEQIVKLISDAPKDQEIIRILALNHKNFNLLQRALNISNNILKAHNKTIQILVGDSSNQVVNLLNLEKIPRAAFSAYCINADTLDFFTTEQELCGSIDMIIAGMGTLSFFKNPQKYLLYMNTWLKKDGKIFLSVYSAAGTKLISYKHLVSQNLKFVTGVSGNIAEYIDTLQSFFRLYCKTYDRKEIEKEVEKYFTVEPEATLSNHKNARNFNADKKIYMHPSICPVVENNIPRKFQEALADMERIYSMHPIHRSEVGYFISVIAQKKLNHFKEPQIIRAEIVHHSDAITRAWHYWLMKEQGLSDLAILKPVLLKPKTAGGTLNQIYCIVIDSKHILTENIADSKPVITGCGSFIEQELRLLTAREINDLGYEIGNLSPFAFYGEENVCQYFYDKNILKTHTNTFIIGSGSAKFSYKLDRKKLLKLFDAYNYIAEDIETNYLQE